MDFEEDEKHGIVIGDPIKNYIFLGQTEDSGENWKISDTHRNEYKMHDSEAFFAASGTNIKLIWDSVSKLAHVHCVSGGKKSRLFVDDKSMELPIIQGMESAGANSIAIRDNKGIVVGGDFMHDTLIDKNCVIITFNLQKREVNFKNPQTTPHGYRSCVDYITKDKLITCGTNGIDISEDGGMNWELISTQGFHVCRKAKKGSKIFLAGTNGKIALISGF